MPKQKTDKPLTDKQKIRLLEQDIKEMQKDFKETFSVFEEGPAKKQKSRLCWLLVLVIILALAAYIYSYYFIQ